VSACSAANTALPCIGVFDVFLFFLLRLYLISNHVSIPHSHPLTPTHIYTYTLSSPSCVWVLWIIQGGKLLHLLGVPSPGCLSSSLVALAYTLPFIRHVALYLRADAEADNAPMAGTSRGVSPSTNMQQLSTPELLLYIVLATVATVWAWQHEIPRTALAALLQRDPTDLQQLALSAAVYLAYIGCNLQVFCPEASTIRSIVLATSGTYLHYLYTFYTLCTLLLHTIYI
jgi:hypothetical protein